MPRSNLPALYHAPIDIDDDIALAQGLLAAAADMPAHRPALMAAVTRVLGVGIAPPPRKPIALRNKTSGLAKAKASPKQLPPPARSTTNGAAGGELKPADVVVSLTKGEETVSFRGRAMEVTGKQALLTQVVAAGLPNLVARSHLEKKVPNLVQLVGPTREALACIGLDLHNVRGMGLMLRVAGQA